MSFNAHLPFLLRRRDDDDYDDNPTPPAPTPSLRRELAKLAATTFVTVSVTKVVEHIYDRWKKKDEKTSS